MLGIVPIQFSKIHEFAVYSFKFAESYF